MTTTPWSTPCTHPGGQFITPLAAGRRVLVDDSPMWASPMRVRAALAAAWGDGRAVLVTRSMRGPADRLAARIWRSWGGQVEVHPTATDVHHGRDTHRDAAGRRRGSRDVTVSVRSGHRVVDHHINPGDYQRAVARAAESVAQLRQAEQHTGRSGVTADHGRTRTDGDTHEDARDEDGMGADGWVRDQGRDEGEGLR